MAVRVALYPLALLCSPYLAAFASNHPSEGVEQVLAVGLVNLENAPVHARSCIIDLVTDAEPHGVCNLVEVRDCHLALYVVQLSGYYLLSYLMLN